MKNYLKTRLEKIRGRFVRGLEALLGHPLVSKILLRLLGDILIWLARLAILGLLSYAGITTSTSF